MPRSPETIAAHDGNTTLTPFRILMLGLDAAGKTSKYMTALPCHSSGNQLTPFLAILYKLKLNQG